MKQTGLESASFGPTGVTVPKAEALVETTSPRIELALTLRVNTKEEHELALALFQELSEVERWVTEYFAEPKAAAHKAHRLLCERERAVLGPIERAKKSLSATCADFSAEMKRKAEEEARRIEAERRKAEEERKLEEAIAAEAEGRPEEAEAILEQPVITPAVRVKPDVAEANGVSTRLTWGAEVADFGALVRYVAANPQWTELLLPNLPKLNALARAMRAEMRIPGVKSLPSVGMAYRRTP